MQLITDNYLELNKQLHETNKEYGVSGKRYALDIFKLAATLKTRDILDYGCGKSTLAMQLPYSIKQYDPAIKKFSALPSPADIVVCTDVLEHIEPEYIDSVIQHLKDLTKKIGYFSIATRPAKKTLADGRNAHLIVEKSSWWLRKLLDHFNIMNLQSTEGDMLVIVEPLEIKH